MAYTLTGSYTIQCDTLAELNIILADITKNPDISNIVHNDSLLTITCDVNATG